MPNEIALLAYGLCECRVWPLVSYQKIGRCKFCGTRPDEKLEADYEAAVKRFVREKHRLPKCFYIRNQLRPEHKPLRMKKPITVAEPHRRLYSTDTT